MSEFCFEPGLTSQDIADALRGLSPRLAANAPVVASGGSQTGRAIFASMSLLRLFGARNLEDLSGRMFAAADPGAKRLADLAANLPLDDAPRLERLRFFLGPATRNITFLCRRVARENAPPLFVAAAIDVADGLNDSAALIPGPAPRPVAHDAVARFSSEGRRIEEARATPTRRPKDGGAIRFLWRTDADDRIVEVTAPLAQVVGAGAAGLIGRDFAEAVRSIAGDEGGRISQILARRDTWSGVEIAWPIAGAGTSVPVRLGAAPSFDRDRRFVGYRGFGVIDSERAAAAKAAALTLDQQDAFHAIACSLGDKPENADMARAPKETDKGACGTASDVAGDVPTGVDARGALVGGAPQALVDGRAIFDLLPIGILACRAHQPIFANRFLLGLLDCADLGRALAARVLEPIVDALPRLARQGETIELCGSAGRPLALRAHRQTIEWGLQEVALVTLLPSAETNLPSLEGQLRGAKSEARELSAILDTATDGVAVLDSQGRIVSLNRSCEALFGYDKNEVAGEPFTMLIAPDNRTRAKDYFEGLKSNGVEILLNDGREIMGLARQGGTIPIFMTLGRISAGAERERDVRFCALLRDMTHWKKVERELEEARRQAERASALKSDFLAKVSHEIRTPLNAILGFAEVIMEERFGPIGNERYKDYLKDIHSSGALVMSLVNDLLDLSKIEAGKMDLEFASVDANRIVSECVSIMQPQASRARVIIRLALGAGLPHVVADERSLRQIVLNLLSNAVKFNQPGGQVIVATALTDAGHAVLRIRDTGVGMSEADIEVALEPFRQLATSRPSGGTGLGLPLTKALVEANRAYFSITSKKHEGTLVEVAFPPTRVLAN